MDHKGSHEAEINDCEHVSDLLHELYRHKKYSDLTICCHGKKFNIHKNIFASCSKYFEDQLQKEVNKNVLNIDFVDEDTMDKLITYVYTGNIILNTKNVGRILCAAARFDLSGLLTHGKNFLIEKTNVNCCVEVWKLAEARTISSISQIATEALFSRLASESREGELCALKYCDFADIMRKEKVTSCSQNRRNNDEPGEKIAYLAIVSWVKHDISARVQHFSSLFSMLRIPALSRDFLKDVVLNENLVRNCVTCLNLVVDELAKEIISPNHRPTSIVTDKPDGFYAVTNDCLVHKFNIEEQTWHSISKTSLKNRKESAIVVLDDTLYVAGGTAPDGCPTNSMIKLNLKHPGFGWVPSKNMLVARKNMGAVSSRGQIYIFGGTGVNSETLSSAETYDPKSDSWKEICDMPEPRSQSAVVSVGELIYALAGSKDGTMLLSTDCYDIATKSWKSAAPIPLTKLYGPSAVTSGASLYLIATIGTHEDLEALKYNLDSNTWVQLASYNLPYLYTSACMVANKVYVVDRWRKGDEIAVYDTACDQWTTVVPQLKLGERIRTLLTA